MQQCTVACRTTLNTFLQREKKMEKEKHLYTYTVFLSGFYDVSHVGKLLPHHRHNHHYLRVQEYITYVYLFCLEESYKNNL